MHALRARPGINCDAIILAAGRGERMRPLTDVCPKPLLQVRGKALMQWHIEALAVGGVRSIVVNTAWLGAQIAAHFGARFAWAGQARSSAGIADSQDAVVRLVYSNEGLDFGGALETAGGIARALPQLADPFWVVAGDVFAPDFPFAPAALQNLQASGKLAHLWLVPNPPHNPNGDFSVSSHGLARNQGQLRHTFSTIGLYRHALFAPPYCDIAAGNPHGVQAAMAPILRAAVAQDRVSAQLYTGRWVDVGTPQRLAELNRPTPT